MNSIVVRTISAAFDLMATLVVLFSDNKLAWETLPPPNRVPGDRFLGPGMRGMVPRLRFGFPEIGWAGWREDQACKVVSSFARE